MALMYIINKKQSFIEVLIKHVLVTNNKKDFDAKSKAHTPLKSYLLY
jgi:hypothetical protein